MATRESHDITLPRVGAGVDAGVRAASRRLSPSGVRDLLLVGLTISSGAVDAISFFGLGRVFTAFMTGNLVFLGVGAMRAGGPGFVRAAVALVGFAVGVYLAVKIVRPTSGSGLWPRRVSITLGVAVVLQAAFLAWWMATAGRPPEGVGAVEGLIALSAVAMGLQSGAVMSLGVPGVFTTAATATVIRFVSDIAHFSVPVIDLRLVTGILAGLFAGAAAGGELLMRARPYAPILPLLASLLVIAVASTALKEAR